MCEQHNKQHNWIHHGLYIRRCVIVLQQNYRKLLKAAGLLPTFCNLRVMFHLNEVGAMPKQELIAEVNHEEKGAAGRPVCVEITFAALKAIMIVIRAWAM